MEGGATRWEYNDASGMEVKKIYADGCTRSKIYTAAADRLVIRESGVWYTYGLDLTKNICEL